MKHPMDPSFWPWSCAALLVVGLAGAASRAAAWAAAAPVNLASAGNFTVLAETKITETGSSNVGGNMGISPDGSSSIAGFGLSMDPSNQFSTSSLVAGKIYAANYAPPTPATMTSAIADMQTAYTDAAGRPADVTELGGGTLSGNTLVPGVYSWSGNLYISSGITLAGGPSAVWIFQIAGTLTTSTTANITLAGGAQQSNIFWQVAQGTSLSSIFYGNILDHTQIALLGATLNGKALAQSAVTFSSSYALSGGYSGSNPPSVGQTFAYPSPAKGGLINVVYTMRGPGTASIRVYNAVGNLAASLRTGEEPAGPQTSPIALGGFAPGVYLYKVVLTYDSGASDSLAVQKFGVTK